MDKHDVQQRFHLVKTMSAPLSHFDLGHRLVTEFVFFQCLYNGTDLHKVCIQNKFEFVEIIVDSTGPLFSNLAMAWWFHSVPCSPSKPSPYVVCMKYSAVLIGAVLELICLEVCPVQFHVILSIFLDVWNRIFGYGSSVRNYFMDMTECLIEWIKNNFYSMYFINDKGAVCLFCWFFFLPHMRDSSLSLRALTLKFNVNIFHMIHTKLKN